MADQKKTVAEQRNYKVQDVAAAKRIARAWLDSLQLARVIGFGLPEVDDRYHYWRVPLLNKGSGGPIGEVVIDARTTLLIEGKSTNPQVLEARLLGRKMTGEATGAANRGRRSPSGLRMSGLRNTIAMGDCEDVLQEFPAESMDLVFTSPPYYNARPEYTDYVTYEEYLLKMRKVIQAVHRVLAEGRFFVINVSPILVRRPSRNHSSKRIAVPFDFHRLFVEEGYDFIDDIIWVKPEGAGWATGRGRRFAADRNPLQYKPVPVTEYVLVYRKHTEKLIDWNIRSHPDQSLVKASQIGDEYKTTNLWYIKPAHDERHPAVFPLELAQTVIKYYSFKGDVVLDPFAGIGTTAKAAVQEGRRFVLVEIEPRFVEVLREEAKIWLGKEAKDVLTVNCDPIDPSESLF